MACSIRNICERFGESSSLLGTLEELVTHWAKKNNKQRKKFSQKHFYKNTLEEQKGSLKRGQKEESQHASCVKGL